MSYRYTLLAITLFIFQYSKGMDTKLELLIKIITTYAQEYNYNNRNEENILLSIAKKPIKKNNEITKKNRISTHHHPVSQRNQTQQRYIQEAA